MFILHNRVDYYIYDPRLRIFTIERDCPLSQRTQNANFPQKADSLVDSVGAITYNPAPATRTKRFFQGESDATTEGTFCSLGCDVFIDTL
ncbi:MAG: hypothetical protein DMF61_25070 [Blastocatellia bacterium AA13]|nr:MAG: hypothetical protein DMF61_25070 [Blastocatellia bacterium AA13]